MKEILRFRNLIMAFAIIDLKFRYRHSVVGIGWSFLEPLIILSILNLVFNKIMATSVKDFPIFLILNLVIFNAFTRSTTISTESILSRSGIIKSVYLKREIFPIAANVTAFLMMIIEFSIVGGFTLAYQFVPTYTALLIPLFLILLFMLTLGLSFALSVLNAHFRDVRVIWTVITQGLFFLSPIIYKMDALPSPVHDIVKLNPLGLIIEMIHNAFLFNMVPNTYDLVYVTSISCVVVIVGWTIFKKLNHTIAEVI